MSLLLKAITASIIRKASNLVGVCVDLSTEYILKKSTELLDQVNKDWDDEGKYIYFDMCEYVYRSIGVEIPFKNKYTEGLKHIFPEVTIPHNLDKVCERDDEETIAIAILYSVITLMNELDKRADTVDGNTLPTRIQSSEFEEKQIYDMLIIDIYNEYIVSSLKDKCKFTDYTSKLHIYPLYIEDYECSLLFSSRFLNLLNIKDLIKLGCYFNIESAKHYYDKNSQLYKQKDKIISDMSQLFRSNNFESLNNMRKYLLSLSAEVVYNLRSVILNKIADEECKERYKAEINNEYNWQLSAINKAEYFSSHKQEERRIPRCELYDVSSREPYV
jgi:hypothetical protein